MQLGLSDWLQLFLSGFSTGCIYALIGLGIIITYSVARVINMAQGEFVMLGAMLTVTFVRALGVGTGLAAAMAVLAVALIGLAVYRLTILPLRRATEVTVLLATIGTGIAIRGLAHVAWGTTPRPLPPFVAAAPIRLAGAALSWQRIWVVACTAAALALLYSFFQGTLLGKAILACSVNRNAAELLGIPARSMGALAYLMSAALGATAGVVIAPLTLASYDMGLALGLKGFVVAVMGGFTSMPAAVVSGILLGTLESYAAGLVSGGLKDALAFLVLLVVLLARTVRLPSLLVRPRRSEA